MKGVQCYELFGGIALKNHAFSFHSFLLRSHTAISLVEYVLCTVSTCIAESPLMSMLPAYT